MEKQLEAITIEKFDPRSLSNENWKQAFEYRRKIHEAITPEDPYLPDEAWRRNIEVQLEDDNMDIAMYVAREKEVIVATANIAWFNPGASGYEENKHAGFVSIDVLPEYRKQGIGKRLLRMIVPIAKEKEIKVLIGGTIEEDGREFANYIGGNEALANIDNRLVLDEVNWDMVREWAEEGRKRNPDTQLEEFEVVPEERLENYTKAFDSTLRQVPVGELEMTMSVNAEEIRKGEEKRRKTGKVQVKLVTVEPDESVSGLTWLTYDPQMPTVLYQGLTGVMEDQRGRGLGKWIKAETLLKARERYPDAKYVKTDNATTNAPMISINERLGFREFRKSYNLQVPLENLQQFLSK